jgi:acyl-CoA thioester hydrolase
MPADPPAAPLVVRRMRLVYGDTDAAQILYFAAWFPWMERVSVEWAAEHGFRYDQMQKLHGSTPVTRATTCEYTATARVYDEIDIAMHLDHIGNTSYRLGFTMTRPTDAVVVARSTLTLVLIDAAGRPSSIPAPYRALLVTDSRGSAA